MVKHIEMINLISMAGLGRRFSEKGHKLPKPLIPVCGEPMILKVIDCLPKARKWIFIVRKEHIDEFFIDEIIKNKIPEAIIVIDTDLIGGASIFCAEKYIDPNEDILVAGCDNGYIFSEENFEKLKSSKKADCILWTFTEDQRLRNSPTSWGYPVLERDNETIENMSIKIPISSDPYFDHAVTATFYISSAKILYEAVRKMVKEDIKVNGEFYLDMLPVVLNMLGKKSVLFDVDLYIGWGTPEELYEFDRTRYYYRSGKFSKMDLPEKIKGAWKIYFSKNEKN